MSVPSPPATSTASASLMISMMSPASPTRSVRITLTFTPARCRMGAQYLSNFFLAPPLDAAGLSITVTLYRGRGRGCSRRPNSAALSQYSAMSADSSRFLLAIWRP